MSTLKTKVTKQLLEDFVKKHDYTDATFEPIEGGELSQAYFFTTAAGNKVLRINSTDEGFHKDKYASDNFASLSVPIPTMEKIGQLEEGLYFAISERVEGKTLDTLNREEVQKLMPQIIAVADAVHVTPPAGTGFGWWRLDGNGKYNSWPEALDARQRAENDDKLADVAFFERDLYNELSAEIKKYYQYCPEERQLIHGDYGFGNMLSDGDKITGIIDWHDSEYGDPLWDVAWLDFWGEGRGYASAFRQHYGEQDRLPDTFDKRLTCYKLIIAATSLAFFAKSEQPEKYNYAKKILASIKR